MKKLLILAALSSMLTGIAEGNDNYLYWMIDEDATVYYDNRDIHNSSKLKDLVSDKVSGTVYASVLVDGGNYLDFYANPGDGTGVRFAPLNVYDSMPIFSGAFANDLNKSFIIELYTDNPNKEGSSWIGATTLSWTEIAAHMTSGGMSVTTPITVSSFQAVPEPTSGMLLLLGVAGLALRRRKQQKA